MGSALGGIAGVAAAATPVGGAAAHGPGSIPGLGGDSSIARMVTDPGVRYELERDPLTTIERYLGRKLSASERDEFWKLLRLAGLTVKPF